MIEDFGRCPTCGAPLIAGRCLACETRRWVRLVRREVSSLFLLVAATVIVFLGTRAMAHRATARHHRQAEVLFAAAAAVSPAPTADAAIVTLRRAVALDPGNRSYRLALADALASSGLDEEARRSLLALHEQMPEDPGADSRLGRLEARHGNLDGARRYFQAALAAVWRPSQSPLRRRLRTELVELLLSQGERPRALSELLLLTPDLGDDAAAETHVGELFLSAGDPRRALEHFTRALQLDGSQPARAGAGQAAFQLGDYAQALRYFDQATPATDEIARARELTALVVSGDPLAPRLTADDRQRRMQRALAAARIKVGACQRFWSASADLAAVNAKFAAFEADWHHAGRRPSRDVIETGFDLVFRIERSAEATCDAAMTPVDRSLLLIGRAHGLSDQ